MSAHPKNLQERDPYDGGMLLSTHAFPVRLADYLRKFYPTLWLSFASMQPGSDAPLQVLPELDSVTVLTLEDQPVLYLQLEALQQKLGTRFQLGFCVLPACDTFGVSVGLADGTRQIVLHRSTLQESSEAETEFLLARELARLELLFSDADDFAATWRCLQHLANSPDAEPVVLRTSQRLRLFTELYCDDRALQVVSDLSAAESAIRKSGVFLPDNIAENASASLTGQEFERHSGNEPVTMTDRRLNAVRAMIGREPGQAPSSCDIDVQGDLKLTELDLLQQEMLWTVTCGFVSQFLKPRWLQTPLRMEHARRFFPDIDAGAAFDHTLEVSTCITSASSDIQRYFCSVLLDLVSCDPAVPEASLAAADQFAAKFGLAELFRHLAREDLEIGKPTLENIVADAADLIQTARSEPAS